MVIFFAVSFVCAQGFAKVHIISQKDKKFNQKEITVAPGDTVSFQNDEADITHNVYSFGPKNAFELKTQAPGNKSDVTFKEAGETDVECAIHSDMKLKIKVK